MNRKKIDKKSYQQEIRNRILAVLEKESGKSFNYKQLALAFGATDPKTRNLIIIELGKLAAKEKIEEVSRGKYRIIPSQNYLHGILDLTSRGNGYVICEELEQDIFIPSNKLNKALHKDEVEVYVYPRRKGKKPEGEITKIFKRGKNLYVGVVQLQKNFGFVVPSDERMYTDIFVPHGNLNGAKDGEKVLVEVLDWPVKADSPFGRILQRFGMPGESSTEIHAILAEYGLPYDFPDGVESEAKELDTAISNFEIKKRRDFRQVLTFTIDPADAKDFDDALSFRILPNGNFEIGIHIADVSHYVHPETLLDKEAYLRGTSVYLVDRVVPMLPEILSNQACSLRPNEEKYTFSAVFEMDTNGKVLNQWFGRTIILSNQRFSYEEAQHVIETKLPLIPDYISLTGISYSVSKPILEAVLKMNDIAIGLRKERMRSGAISFDKVEVKFRLNQENDPIGVYFKEAKEANKLIEEFMLMANRSVAEFIGKKKPKHTFVYRVHDEPNPDKLLGLNGVIARFGYKLNLENRQTITQSLNRLLEKVSARKEQNLVDTLAIRSMAKAKYTTENIGHYGLAFDYYTHFTSPIRRYPDVLVHRLLQHYLEGGTSVKEEEYEEYCAHSSDREITAANAERDSIKYMQVKFMQDHKDQQFEGVISGVTEWGMYVEITENKCEGLVRIRDIRDDYYVYDERQYALVGQVTHNMYQLGDEVLVEVAHTDLIKRHLDLRLIGKK